MKPEYVVAIGLRLLAIYLSVTTITGLITSAWFYIGAGFSPLLVFVTVLSLAAACLLWRFALWIALRLVGADGSVNTNTSPTSMTIEQVQNLAFTVLGIYFLFRAVTAAVYWLVFFGGSPTPREIDLRQWASIAENIAEFFLPGFLVLRAEGLTVLISKVRQAGRDNAL